MKIAFILPSLANTGPAIVVRDLCTGLAQAGHVCKVFYFDDEAELGMPCPTERIAFRKAIDFAAWDIVHSHMLRPDVYVWYHTRGNKYPHTAFITTLHNPIDARILRLTYSIPKSLLSQWAWKIALPRFDRVIALNGALRQNYLKTVAAERLAIIFNGRDIRPGEPADEGDKYRILDLKQRYTVIGTTSGINRRKGLEQMVRALADLPGYAFVAVGDGPELGNLQALADELGVAERCLWTGYRDDAANYQPLFDIFVMCTRSEGFPLALIEAAGHGIPAVLSDIPVLRSVISDREAAFYELDNIASLVSAVGKVAAHRKQYADRIHNYYRATLTLEAMTRAYLDVYQAVLQAKRGHAG